MPLRVSDIAERAGVSPDAVRFYEKEGLLPPARRSPSGYREFDNSTAHRIRFIKNAQGLGLRLNEVRELLEIQDRGACPCGHTKQLVERRIQEIDAETARLGELRRGLQAIAELECAATEQSEVWNCEIDFFGKGGEP